jgi:hypothetical protein
MRKLRLATLALLGVVVLLALQTSNSSNVDNLSTYANLYEDTPAGTVITLTTNGTFYPWVSTTVGESRGMTPSAASDNITVLSPGTYYISAGISWLGAASANYHWTLFQAGAEVSRLEGESAVGATPLTQNAAWSGLITAVAGDTLDLRVTSSVDTKTATVYHIQFTVLRVF